MKTKLGYRDYNLKNHWCRRIFDCGCRYDFQSHWDTYHFNNHFVCQQHKTDYHFIRGELRRITPIQ